MKKGVLEFFVFFVVGVFLTGSVSALVEIAYDGLESNTWSGGTGWNGAWYHQGSTNAKIVSDSSPYAGNYHLRLRKNNG